MNDIVVLIQKVREQRKRLENQERELMSTLCYPSLTVDLVLIEFLKLKGVDFFEDNRQKKMFIFVCSSICCPMFITGDRLKKGFRFKMAKLTKLHPEQVSYILGEVRISYKTYKDFKQEADYLYDSIRRSLTS